MVGRPYFIGELDIRPLPAENQALLLEDLGYASDLVEDEIWARKGFVSDGWSVPRPCWFFMPHWGEHAECAVIHDKLYRDQVFERATCDGILLEAMTLRGINPVKRQLIYRMIRWFGQAAWDEDAKRRKAA